MKHSRKSLIITSALVLALAVGAWVLLKKDSGSSSTTNVSSDTGQTKKQRYASEEECLKAGNSRCNYAMCDYVPKGKTREEVCGKDYEDGWVGQN